jgi:hypothetical protein
LKAFIWGYPVYDVIRIAVGGCSPDLSALSSLWAYSWCLWSEKMGDTTFVNGAYEPESRKTLILKNYSNNSRKHKPRSSSQSSITRPRRHPKPTPSRAGPVISDTKITIIRQRGKPYMRSFFYSLCKLSTPNATKGTLR